MGIVRAIRRGIAIGLVAGATCVSAVAGDPPDPLGAADAALAAWKAGDRDALAKIAAADEPDPWLVADLLCMRGEVDAAKALSLAGGPDLERLPAYLATRRTDPTAAEEATALARAQTLLLGKEPARALEILDAMVGPTAGVPRVDRLRLRGDAFHDLGRFPESAAAFEEAATAAHELGWASGETGSWADAGRSAFHGGDPARALVAWERQLEVSLARGHGGDAAEARWRVAMAITSLPEPGERLAAAQEHAEAALRWFTERADGLGRARALAQIGSVHRRRNEFAEAIRAFDEAILLFRAGADEQSALASQENRVLALLGLVRIEEAIAGYFDLAAAAEARGDPGPRAVYLTLAASLRAQRGNNEGILEATDAAIPILERLGNLPYLSDARTARGHAFRAADRLDEARAEFERAISDAERAGDASRKAAALTGLALVLAADNDLAAAEARANEGLAIHRAIRDTTNESVDLGLLAQFARQATRWEEAERLWQDALAALGPADPAWIAAKHWVGLAMVHSARGDAEGAVAAYTRAVQLQERFGLVSEAFESLHNLSVAYRTLGDYERARETLDRAEALAIQTGVPAHRATVLKARGVLRWAEDDQPGALALYEEAVGILEAAGPKEQLLDALIGTGDLAQNVGDIPRAVALYLRALAIAREKGLHAREADVNDALASAWMAGGELGRALETVDRAIATQERMGLRPNLALSLYDRAQILWRAGDLPEALRSAERALAIHAEYRNRPGEAQARGILAQVHLAIGDWDRAIEQSRAAIEIAEATENRVVAAEAQVVLGLILSKAGRLDEAARLLEAAVVRTKSGASPRAHATAVRNLAGLLLRRGDLTRAIELFESVEPTADLGVAYAMAQRLPEAIAILTHAAESPREDLGQRAYAMGNLAEAYRMAGDLEHAISTARRAIDEMTILLRGLGDEQGVASRAHWADVYDTGSAAALAAGRAEDFAWFLESGRAGALREALGGARALYAQAVPETLRVEEQAARGKEAMAAAALRVAEAAGERRAVREGRKALEEARRAVREVVERIQREAKGRAELVYPKADELGTIRARLAEDETYVLYGLSTAGSAALVATRDEARLVRLEEFAAIEAACTEAASVLTEPSVSARSALARLRALLVEPLALPASSRRVLVSPVGPLARLPLPVLFQGREVTLVPSATTHAILLGDGARRGTGVLALADPDYGRSADAEATALLTRGRTLLPLPGSRAEAEAIASGPADLRLLGSEASEERFLAAVRTRSRWRSVHFACHGLVDSDLPAMCSLAFTPGAQSDGFWTAQEICRVDLPADLVVLSACETGAGKIVQGEGILGLTRAFMFAGAPRVICSLWDVDDEATRALMTKFYEVWNPRGGGPGLGTAAALVAAQEHVRSQERWRHPYFWAAWVLWGLGD